jgi:4-carboxymuconolactone decarboxylase
MDSKSPRLPPLELDEFTDEQAELAGGRGSPRGELSIVRLLVQNPALYRSWMPFAMHLITASSLSPREREIVILHTCAFCRGTYDVAQHRLIAQRAGVSVVDIDAAIGDGAGLSAFERTLIKAVEELAKDHCIADATYAVLAERYTPQQLLDLVFTVGNYVLMSMTTNTFAVKVEANIESGWKPN